MPKSILAQEFRSEGLSAEKRGAWILQAHKLRASQQYKKAIRVIDSILYKNESDEDMLLFKGDLLMQDNNFKEASKSLQQLKLLQPRNSVARINLSYALFKSHKPEKALHHAKEAWLIDTSNVNAMVNYFNAMLWNKEINNAKHFYTKIFKKLNSDQRLVLMARLHMTKGDFRKGLKLYDSLYTTTKNKYYVKEYAEVLLGKGDIQKSRMVMLNRRDIFNSTEWTDYINKYKAQTMNRIGCEMVLFKDIANNIRKEATVNWRQGGDKNLKAGVGAGVSQFSVNGSQITTMNHGHINLRQRWNASLSAFSEIIVQSIKTEENKSIQTVVGRQVLKYQPHDRRMFSLFYNSEVLNYTANLLRRNIRAHDLGGITHLMLSPRIGIYSQASLAFIGDGNQRKQWFGSIYHLFRTNPTLKVGWNNSFLSYEQIKPEYFSPYRYLNTELFAEFQYQNPKWKNFYFNSQAGLGIQQIEDQAAKAGYRYEGEIGVQRLRFDVSLRYRRSNVAINSGTGYQFHWLTIKGVYKWN